MNGSILKKTGILLCLSFVMPLPANAGLATGESHTLAHRGLSTQQLLQQCQPLLEGSQSLMGAFQSGQCSSYILGIYDLVAEHCSAISENRNQVVLSTLKHLSDLNPKPLSAVQAIDQYLTQQTQCLPVASR